MQKILATALGVVVALAAVLAVDAQENPPHRFYGSGDGAAIAVDGQAVEVSGDGWYIDIAGDGSTDGLSWTINGDAADAVYNSTGATQTEVTLTLAPVAAPDPCPDDATSDDDSMMSEDSMEEDSMMSEDDDSMMSGDDDSMLDCPEPGDDATDDDDAMMGDDDAMLDEDTAYPATGTGGLADTGGVSAGLIGLLIALAAVTMAGLGLRRIRNRA